MDDENANGLETSTKKKKRYRPKLKKSKQPSAESSNEHRGAPVAGPSAPVVIQRSADQGVGVVSGGINCTISKVSAPSSHGVDQIDFRGGFTPIIKRQTPKVESESGSHLHKSGTGIQNHPVTPTGSQTPNPSTSAQSEINNSRDIPCRIQTRRRYRKSKPKMSNSTNETSTPSENEDRSKQRPQAQKQSQSADLNSNSGNKEQRNTGSTKPEMPLQKQEVKLVWPKSFLQPPGPALAPASAPSLSYTKCEQGPSRPRFATPASQRPHGAAQHSSHNSTSFHNNGKRTSPVNWRSEQGSRYQYQGSERPYNQNAKRSDRQYHPNQSQNYQNRQQQQPHKTRSEYNQNQNLPNRQNQRWNRSDYNQNAPSTSQNQRSTNNSEYNHNPNPAKRANQRPPKQEYFAKGHEQSQSRGQRRNRRKGAPKAAQPGASNPSLNNMPEDVEPRANNNGQDLARKKKSRRSQLEQDLLIPSSSSSSSDSDNDDSSGKNKSLESELEGEKGENNQSQEESLSHDQTIELGKESVVKTEELGADLLHETNTICLVSPTRGNVIEEKNASEREKDEDVEFYGWKYWGQDFAEIKI